MMVIFKSQQYWVQWCDFKQVTSGHDINPSFVWKFDFSIIWKFGVIRIQDETSAYNKFYTSWSAILRRLLKWYLIHCNEEPWHLTDDHCRPQGGNVWHLNILWQHQRMMWRFTQRSKVGVSETRFWDLKLRQMRFLFIELYFPVGNLGDHVQTPGRKHSKLRMQDFRHSLGQDLWKSSVENI